nr:MAG TPA: hypothetical protein [Caudoviricetes sp.]
MTWSTNLHIKKSRGIHSTPTTFSIILLYHKGDRE